jgi:uncharacterized damage-inducible protein DinB
MRVRINALAEEFAGEAAKTRPLLERLPDHRFDWRPHMKSYTAGGLAGHLVDCLAWTHWIFSADEFDFDPRTYQACRATTTAELLTDFDAVATKSAKALAAASDASLEEPWRMKIKGRVRFEKTKGEVLRDFTLSHVIHHRGQFSVYLRILDVPVPGVYGPSADDRG